MRMWCKGSSKTGVGRDVVEALMLGELAIRIFPQGLKPVLYATVMSELKLRPPVKAQTPKSRHRLKSGCATRSLIKSGSLVNR